MRPTYGIQKQVVALLMGNLLPQPAVLTKNVPSTAQVTLLRQGDRRVAHVLYYPLTRRAPVSTSSRNRPCSKASRSRSEYVGHRAELP